MKRVLFFIMSILVASISLAQDTNSQIIKGSDTELRSFECLQGATFSQLPVVPMGSFSSSTQSENHAVQKMQNINSIKLIRFFGVQLFYSDLGWIPCNETDPFTFKFTFFEDNEGIPGNEIMNFDEVTLSHNFTEETLTVAPNTYQVYYWDWIPDEAITALPDSYFLGIQNTNSGCGFAWVCSNNYSGGLRNYDGSWHVTDCGFTFCITDENISVSTLDEIGIKIYPNPTNGVVSFDFSDNDIQKIKISDITGKVIIEKTSINKMEVVDFSYFKIGIYLIEIQMNGKIITTKIVKK